MSPTRRRRNAWPLASMPRLFFIRATPRTAAGARAQCVELGKAQAREREAGVERRDQIHERARATAATARARGRTAGRARRAMTAARSSALACSASASYRKSRWLSHALAQSDSRHADRRKQQERQHGERHRNPQRDRDQRVERRRRPTVPPCLCSSAGKCRDSTTRTNTGPAKTAIAASASAPAASVISTNATMAPPAVANRAGFRVESDRGERARDERRERVGEWRAERDRRDEPQHDRRRRAAAATSSEHAPIASSGSARASARTTSFIVLAAVAVASGSQRKPPASTPATRCAMAASTQRRVAAHAELDPPAAVGQERRQAEKLQLRKARDVVVHHGKELALAGAMDDDRALGGRRRGERRIARREHPVEHRPRHLRKAREEVVIADRERCDAIHRIRNDRAAFREIGHQHAMRPGVLAEARLDFGERLADAARAARRSAAAAACRVWSSGVAPTPPNANTISPRRERFAQHRGEPRAIVAFVARPREGEPARRRASRSHARDACRRACPTGSRRR